MAKDSQPSEKLIAGVDEAGRGPLAGPVYAAAVILHPGSRIHDLMDSKLLAEPKREIVAKKIQEGALAWAVATADVDEIDELNILQASLLAMKRAVEALSTEPEEVLVDGNKAPELKYPTQAIIKGDLKIRVIGAASILAKVARDAEMLRLDKEYPGYGFAQHKGYGTKVHLQALKTLGPSPIHRKSFKPVAELL